MTEGTCSANFACQILRDWHNRRMKTSNLIHSSCKRSALLCFSLLIAWPELLPQAQAVDPPPDGGYPNRNTAEGEDAFFNHVSGGDNVAVGYPALYIGATG